MKTTASRCRTSPTTRKRSTTFTYKVENRDLLQSALAQADISTLIHYPVPLHLQKAYAGLGYGPGSFPISERIAARLLSLPMFPNLKLSQQARVVEQVREWIGRRQNTPVMA